MGDLSNIEGRQGRIAMRPYGTVWNGYSSFLQGILSDIMRQVFFLPIILGLLTIIIVNESSPSPTSQRLEVCSRYCHDHGCPHFGQAATPTWMLILHDAHIHWFKNNPFGLSYQHFNLLVYVGIYPVLLLFLWWNLIRKKPSQ